MPANFALAVVNPAVTSGSQAVVYQNVSATLDVTLTNSTGAPVTFQTGASPSALQVFLPLFYTAPELSVMTIAAPPAGWTFAYDANILALVLTFAGTSAESTWADGAVLAFSIGNATATAQPTIGSIQVNPQNMSGDIPPQVQTPLTLSLPPQPGSPQLSKVLQVSLDTQGVVYVSPSGDPLPNTLFLNLKNTSDAPLFSGKAWPSKPQVSVSFVYGQTAGSLAPDLDKSAPQTGSAWNITAAVQNAQGNAWQPVNPSNTGNLPNPVWLLEPINTDLNIIGVKGAANISFNFSNIISFTQPGHTQMVLSFSAFPANDTTLYDDITFVIDIVKLNPPPTRGVMSFYGNAPIVTVFSQLQQVSIALNWNMIYVDSILLICSVPGVAPYAKSYPSAQALGYDSTTVSFSGVVGSGPVFLTLQAYDAQGNFLNSLQYSVFLDALEYVDPRDGQCYSAVRIGGLVWMSENLNWEGGGAYYDNNGSYATPYGRLYTAASAPPPPGTGWRLPSQDDWNQLVAAAGNDPYAALINQGSSGFNAQLGGQTDNLGNSTGLGSWGYYWTSTEQQSPALYYAQFYAGSPGVNPSVVVDNANLPTFSLSVRYVRNG